MKGADPKVKDSQGREPIHMTKGIKNKQMVTKLLSLINATNGCCCSRRKRYSPQSFRNMKGSKGNIVCFIIFFGIFMLTLNYFFFPTLNQNYWKLTSNVLAIFSCLFFIASWIIPPGYLEKKSEGEFLLLLTKFDPRCLCPYC